ncbi:AraC family transcriptional regulator [Flavobacterium akiainvivens]|uniref:AraC family transcriptional regulator n=1 Tax=Flavobacterium akiainvivens TaxID=1202724 RepID=A0A0M8MGI2_9FLAO|nr:response regulator transcription factor [Flavobacterium akiainvivens]KOS05297.1 AraC family transcriptional regulator [Flavobacterium akiainvivens]SFQ76227.1 transcriptional regulator, AraC family [Flavobacterium akiainvivens]
MKKDSLYIVNSISELHSFLNLPKPTHPLVSVINLSEVRYSIPEKTQSIVYNFYTVYLKKNYNAKIRYGQQYYDFDSGIMAFFAPKQLFAVESDSTTKAEGWMLVFHPDFIQGFPLARKMKDYGFFSYAVNEALHTSQKEEDMISGIMLNLQEEIEKMIDHYTQDVIISHVELLLNYCNRFYNRQFITRKHANNEILSNLENLINDYFEDGFVEKSGIPSVQYIAEKLNLSPNYLSDMLRSLTGQNTQQHIHNKLIDKAKELLSTTELSVAEIAYQLGFEHPQSFHKLFKGKTNVSPLKFRQSLN